MVLLSRMTDRRLMQTAETVGASERVLELWDLTTPSKLFEVAHLNVGPQLTAFSPDGGRLALAHTQLDGSQSFRLLDTESGRTVVELTNVRQTFEMAFSSDASLLYCHYQRPDDKYALAMFDTESGRQLWARDDAWSAGFTRLGSLMYYTNRFDNGLEFVDGATGITQAVTASDWTAWQAPSFSSDGRFCAIEGFVRAPQRFAEGSWLATIWEKWFARGGYGVTVLETETGREPVRVFSREGERWSSSHLSDDGSTLVTVAHPRGVPRLLQVWDVSGRRAWTWAIAASGGVAFGLLGVKWIWVRTRRARTKRGERRA
jgi:hypothetical protein